MLEKVKKHIWQGQPLDFRDLRKELGDALWYAAVMCEDLGWDLVEIMEENIQKLRQRYPDGFSAERSINRDE